MARAFAVKRVAADLNQHRRALGHVSADRRHRAMGIGPGVAGVEEAGALLTDIDEGAVCPSQQSRDPAEIEIADDTLAPRPVMAKLDDPRAVEQGDARLAGRHIDDQRIDHDEEPRRPRPPSRVAVSYSGNPTTFE